MKFCSHYYNEDINILKIKEFCLIKFLIERMKQMKYYHGTDFLSAQNILKNGFSSNKETVWTCSVPNYLYVAREDYDDYDDYDGDFDDMLDIPAVRIAVEAAQIAAAHTNQLTKDVFVFEFDIPDDIEVEEDVSCENMYGCYQLDVNELNSNIQDGTIQVTAYKFNNAYVPDLRIFYLTNLNSQYYAFLDNELASIADKLKTSVQDWFYEDYVGTWSGHETIDLLESVFGQRDMLEADEDIELG